jgi:hypothetical protein
MNRQRTATHRARMLDFTCDGFMSRLLQICNNHNCVTVCELLLSVDSTLTSQNVDLRPCRSIFPFLHFCSNSPSDIFATEGVAKAQFRLSFS